MQCQGIPSLKSLQKAVCTWSDLDNYLLGTTIQQSGCSHLCPWKFTIFTVGGPIWVVKRPGVSYWPRLIFSGVKRIFLLIILPTSATLPWPSLQMKMQFLHFHTYLHIFSVPIDTKRTVMLPWVSFHVGALAFLIFLLWASACNADIRAWNGWGTCHSLRWSPTLFCLPKPVSGLSRSLAKWLSLENRFWRAL